MDKDNVISFQTQDYFEDPLTEVIRAGARKLLACGLEAEVAGFLQRYEDQRSENGLRAVVRSGYQPERSIQTGVGPVTVRVPKVRSNTGEPVSFHSGLIPPYVRKSRSVEAFVPWLFLKGVSSGEMGETASGFSASTVSRLTQQWQAQMQQWKSRDLAQERFVYVWADGIDCGLRAQDVKLCVLVVIGVNEHGEKKFLAIEDGMRESTESWCEVLRDLKRRGLCVTESCGG